MRKKSSRVPSWALFDVSADHISNGGKAPQKFLRRNDDMGRIALYLVRRYPQYTPLSELQKMLKRARSIDERVSHFNRQWPKTFAAELSEDGKSIRVKLLKLEALQQPERDQLTDGEVLGRESEFQAAVKELELEQGTVLDEEANILRRTEQGFLRNWLFGRRKIEKCGICGREMPVDLLVTAHVKRRAACTLDEKMDYKKNVMPMCKLGCDDLFEKGYITVSKDGTIMAGKSLTQTEAVRSYINSIEGCRCDHWNSESSEYFKWHRQESEQRA